MSANGIMRLFWAGSIAINVLSISLEGQQHGADPLSAPGARSGRAAAARLLKEFQPFTALDTVGIPYYERMYRLITSEPLTIKVTNGATSKPVTDTITEGLSKEVGDRGAMAACYRGSPIVGYSRDYLARMTPEAFQFFRYHELGHHTLGHVVKCYPFEVFSPAKSREHDADCWAVAQLRTRGLPGLFAVVSAAERFFISHDQGDDVYPSYYARHELLMGGCGTALDS